MSDSCGIIGVGDTSKRLVFLLAGQSNMAGRAPLDEEAGRTDPRIPHSACVSSVGLADKGDRKHFDTPAQRELGRRYAEAFLANRRH